MRTGSFMNLLPLGLLLIPMFAYAEPTAENGWRIDYSDQEYIHSNDPGFDAVGGMFLGLALWAALIIGIGAILAVFRVRIIRFVFNIIHKFK